MRWLSYVQRRPETHCVAIGDSDSLGSKHSRMRGLRK